MKKNSIILIKNIFCIITIIWSGIMLIEYSLILTSIEFEWFLFKIVEYVFVFLLYMGLFAVPLLLLLSIILIVIVSVKHKNADNKVINTITVVTPVILGILMLLTVFFSFAVIEDNNGRKENYNIRFD